MKNAIAKEFGFEVIPYEFIVDSNYPNPFNPITTIYYEIPEEGKVEIDFINLAGQVLESGTLFHVPGHYEYIWDASAYPSGIYFYNMKFNGVSKSYHKMMLIK